MPVKVKLLGGLRGLAGKEAIFIELDGISVVKELFHKLAEDTPPEFRRALLDPELNDPRPNALILINEREISVLDGLESQVRDGDEVTLVSVSHGG
ncbi:MAG: MoaD/ThiS family protein [Candidatus Bathyarchaeota archaeon]|nr:MAG: MoaD/ThiS family protein [Candidatus Bathyarchaeota archaeon]